LKLDWYSRSDDASRTALPVIVFDGDDTLWATEALYDEARASSGAIVEDLGLDPHRFDELQRQVDVTNVKRYGFSKVRFPTSSKEAYEALVAEAGLKAVPSVAQAVYRASARVFEVPAPLNPQARATLRQMKEQYRVTVRTKGDSWVQRKRLADSGLVPLLDGACIVDEKDSTSFKGMLTDLGTDVSSAWSVGNSYGSDVHPAVEVGMRALWIAAQVWAHELSLSARVITSDDPNVFVASELAEVQRIIGSQPLQRPTK
jgi:putative hydrolase of the HAD superfamily